MTFPIAPRDSGGNDVDSVRRYAVKIATVANLAMRGKINAVVLEFTLTANQASTVLTDARLTVQSFVEFDPLTSNAASEKAAGTIYVTSANRANGSFTVTHANNAQTDRTFNVLIIG